eukprot:jgi/Mesvir1/21985/Mv04521-RA.1
MRPRPPGSHQLEPGVRDPSDPPQKPSGEARSGVEPLPLYTVRGGYGPQPPDYTTAPTMRPGLGYGRNSSAIPLHVEAPKGYVPSNEFHSMTAAPVKFGTLSSKVPGPEPWTSKTIQKVSDVVGAAGPDRKFGMQEVYAQQGARDNFVRESTDILSKNWTQVEDQIMIAKPTEQEAQLQTRMVILDPFNRANRSGMESRAANAEYEGHDRPYDSKDMQATVLPERSIPLSTFEPVVDRTGGSANGMRWADMQDFTRVVARRAKVIDNAHLPPIEAPFQQALAVGAYNIVPRVPVNERTHKALAVNYAYENKGEGLHSEAELNNHTRTAEPRVFRNTEAAAENPEGKLLYKDFMVTTRLRDIDDGQLEAVRTSPEDAAMVQQNRGWMESDRVERPVRLGAMDFQRVVTDVSADVAYSALDKNPLYIPNVNQTPLDSSEYEGPDYLFGG